MIEIEASTSVASEGRMQKFLGLALQAKRCCEAPWGINQSRLSSR